MSLSTSPSKVKFLLDENVDRRLESFLGSRGFDVASPRGLSNGKLAGISKSEKRALVTNDEDFADSELYPKEKLFAIILLKIPQNEPDSLLAAFSRLLEERESFEGHLIILTKEKSEVFPLAVWKEFKQ